MRVVITGAAGFIGSHLSEALLNKGAKVVGIDNLLTGDLANIAHLRDRDFQFIRHDVTHTIFRVTVERAPAQQRPMARNVVEGRAPVAGTTSAAGAATATAVAAGGGNGAQPARSGPKIGRNDPCWCGSGKKYKKCHGA